MGFFTRREKTPLDDFLSEINNHSQSTVYEDVECHNINGKITKTEITLGKGGIIFKDRFSGEMYYLRRTYERKVHKSNDGSYETCKMILTRKESAFEVIVALDLNEKLIDFFNEKTRYLLA